MRCRWGSVEQHANLSLAVDAILSERVAVEAAETTGVPVFPAVAYGVTPYFLAYPGSVSLRVGTYGGGSFATSWTACAALVSDACCWSTAMAATSRRAGCSRSNTWPTTPEMQIRFHNWWSAPRDLRQGAGDRPGRLARVLDGELSVDAARGRRPAQASSKPMIDLERMRADQSGKGSGPIWGTAISVEYYERPDEDMLADLEGRGRGDAGAAGKALGVK